MGDYNSVMYSHEHCKLLPIAQTHCVNFYPYPKLKALYCQTFNISRTKTQTWNVSYLALQLSLHNPLKPDVGREQRCSGNSADRLRPTISEWSINLWPTKVRHILEVSRQYSYLNQAPVRVPQRVHRIRGRCRPSSSHLHSTLSCCWCRRRDVWHFSCKLRTPHWTWKTCKEWGLQRPISSLHYSRIYSKQLKTTPPKYYVHIWQVFLQLRCDDRCEMIRASMHLSDTFVEPIFFLIDTLKNGYSVAPQPKMCLPSTVIILLSWWWTMVSPTQLCWRYHSLPLRQWFIPKWYSISQYCTCRQH